MSKRWCCSLILFMLFSFTGFACADETPAPEPDGPIWITPFKDHKAGAFTLTFDDGTADQIDHAIPILAEHHLRATFYVCPSWIPEKRVDLSKIDLNSIEDKKERKKLKRQASYASWEDWNAAVKSGHEVGNHSMWHPNFKDIEDPEKLKFQIVRAYEILNEKLGERPMSFCYPFHGRTAEAEKIVDQYHLGSRGECKHYGGKHFKAKHANRFVDQAIQNRTWVVAMLHGITGHYSPTDPEVFKEHVAYIASKREALWVAPFVEVWQYQWQRENAQFTDWHVDHNQASFNASCSKPLDHALIEVTFIITIPEGKSVKSVTHNEQEITFKQDGIQVQFNAIPEGAFIMSW